MRSLAAAYGEEIVQQPVAQLPWGHVTVLLDKLDDRADRDWYAASAVEHGWSRNVLAHQITNRLRQRSGAAPSNFEQRLPAEDSDLARQLLRDPYVFDFLDHRERAGERDLETVLMDRLQAFLLELGHGFAFVARQYHFEVDGDDFYIDLLFFNWAQNRFVVVELKVGKFAPEYAGQLGSTSPGPTTSCGTPRPTCLPSASCCAPAATNGSCATPSPGPQHRSLWRATTPCRLPFANWSPPTSS